MSSVDQTLGVVVTDTAPQWVKNQASYRWFKFATGSASTGWSGGSRIDQVKPSPTPSGASPEPGVTAYSGGCMDTDRDELLVHGGGHGGYSGNEIYALRVRTETPGWYRICDPSSGCYATQPAVRGGNGQYDYDSGRNGAPRGSHTWNHLAYGNNKVCLPFLGGMELNTNVDVLGHVSSYADSHGTARIFYYDRGFQNAWVAGEYWHKRSELAAWATQFAQGGPAFYCDVRTSFFASLQSWLDPASSWIMVEIDAGSMHIKNRVSVNSTSGFWSAAVTPIPGTAHNMVRSGESPYGIQYGGPGLYYWNANSYYANPQLLTVVDSVVDSFYRDSWKGESRGAVWHQASQQMLVFVGSGSFEYFVKLAPTAVGCYRGTWQASLVGPDNTADGSRVIPYNPGALTFGRWNMVQDMGDEGGGVRRSLLMMLPDQGVNGPTYGMLIPNSGM